MKKNVIFLFSVILTLNYLTLAANDYIYGEKEQKTYTTANLEGTLCNFRFVLVDKLEFGWVPTHGIGIIVDGVDYGFLNLAWGESYAEEIVALPSGEVKLSWFGSFPSRYHFEVYNPSDELIYTSPDDLWTGVFLTYQNECVECIPITDFEGIYISEEHQVNLSWAAPESADVIGFDIFRNDELIDHLPPATVFYSDYTAELEDGDYKYCVIPVYPSICTLEDKCFDTYISNVGIVDYKNNILIYPNPANDVINITGDIISTVKMYNNIGQLILTQHNTNTINVTALQNGIYLLTIETTTGNMIQKKIIKN